mmetsp:Transcript_14735/g.61430  ORF Transcript_14735/g.61430 Transcript_14735/m.61430 type:complete len:239 (-) Transcript_14735:238-954(-)
MLLTLCSSDMSSCEMVTKYLLRCVPLEKAGVPARVPPALVSPAASAARLAPRWKRATGPTPSDSLARFSSASDAAAPSVACASPKDTSAVQNSSFESSPSPSLSRSLKTTLALPKVRCKSGKRSASRSIDTPVGWRRTRVVTGDRCVPPSTPPLAASALPPAPASSPSPLFWPRWPSAAVALTASAYEIPPGVVGAGAPFLAGLGAGVGARDTDAVRDVDARASASSTALRFSMAFMS